MLNPKIKNEIDKKVKKYLPLVKDIYKKIHMNPEIGWDVFETSKIVQNQLKKINIPYKTLNKTGVVGLLDTKKQGKCLLLRADMDALEINEETELIYKSKVPNKMHACGHDSHTANLLGAAIILNELKHFFKGKVKFMFQPNEEMQEGGANKMIELGLLKNPAVDAAIAIHVGDGSQLYKEDGKILLTYGSEFASLTEFKIIFKGESGHIASYKKSIDPLHAASLFISEIKKMNETIIHKDDPSLVGIAGIKPDTYATNIIPNTITLLGGIRTLKRSTYKEILKNVKELLGKIKKTTKVDYEFITLLDWPSVENDKNITDIVYQSSKFMLGNSNVLLEKEQTMGAEDFSFISQKIPSCMYRITVEPSSRLHNCNFKINLDKFFTASLKTMVASAIAFLVK